MGSHVVLIQWAALGRFMRRAKQWACVGAGSINSGFGPKKQRYSQCPHFFQLKVGVSSVGKNTMLLNLEWRKLKELGELMLALNVCLDIKRV